MATEADKAFILSCSFCGKPHTQVKKLVAGPGVYICDECTDLCNQIIAEELLKSGGLPATKKIPTEDELLDVLLGEPEASTSPTQRIPNWDSLTEEGILEQLPRLAAAQDQVELSLKAGVKRLRERGVTWKRIGEAFGITRQSAWERFSDEE